MLSMGGDSADAKSHPYVLLNVLKSANVVKGVRQNVVKGVRQSKGSVNSIDKFTFGLSRAMARKLRVQYPGAIYHVMNRGDRREPIFKDEVDRERFLSSVIVSKRGSVLGRFLVLATPCFPISIKREKSPSIEQARVVLLRFLARQSVAARSTLPL